MDIHNNSDLVCLKNLGITNLSRRRVQWAEIPGLGAVAVCPNNECDTKFGGTPRLDEIDEEGSPRKHPELLLAPNIGRADVPRQFAHNELLELKTEGVGPNVGKLDVPEEASELLAPNKGQADA